MFLRGSEDYLKIAQRSDLLYREGYNQYITFESYGIVLQLPNSSNVFPLEIYNGVKEALYQFDGWISDNIQNLNSQDCYRERETLRLVMHFDTERILVDQSGPYFPGLKYFMSHT